MLRVEHDPDWLPPPPAAHTIGADPALLQRLVHPLPRGFGFRFSLTTAS